MLIDDPQKLQAALEQLEAEKQRRIGEKLSTGKAVLGSDVIVTGVPRDDESWERPALDDDGREIYYAVGHDADGREIYSHEPMMIVTGVPRRGRDYDDPDDPPTRVHNVSKPDAEKRRPEGEALRLPEGLRGSAAVVPAPEPPREPNPRYVRTELRQPSGDPGDAGEVVEGFFDIKDGMLFVWDAQGDRPIGSQPIRPGDNKEAAARKLLREKSGKHSSFYQPIRYPRGSVH